MKKLKLIISILIILFGFIMIAELFMMSLETIETSGYRGRTELINVIGGLVIPIYIIPLTLSIYIILFGIKRVKKIVEDK